MSCRAHTGTAPYLRVPSVSILRQVLFFFPLSPLTVSGNKSQGRTASSGSFLFTKGCVHKGHFQLRAVKGPFSPGLWFLWQYISLKYLRGFFSICFQSVPHASNHTHTFKYLVLKSPVALCFLNCLSFSLNLMVAI